MPVKPVQITLKINLNIEILLSMCSSSQNKDSHGKLHSPFQVLFQRSRVLFLYECSKFISFCILAERAANTIMDTVDFEEAAALSAQRSLASGRKKKELSESP